MHGALHRSAKYAKPLDQELREMKDTCVIKLRWFRGEGHDRVTIFMGPDGDHLANCGTLTMRPEEAEHFRMTVKIGIQHPGCSGMFEAGWER